MVSPKDSIVAKYHSAEIEALKCIRHIVDAMDEVDTDSALTWCIALEGFLDKMTNLKVQFGEEK